MKKKIFSVLAIAIIACMCVFGLAACGGGDNGGGNGGNGEVINVAGKTFVYEGVKVTGPGASAEMLKQIEESLVDYNHDHKWSFGNNGQVYAGLISTGETEATMAYKQVGDKVYLGEEGEESREYFTVSGGKIHLIYIDTIDGVTITSTITFKQQ